MVQAITGSFVTVMLALIYTIRQNFQLLHSLQASSKKLEVFEVRMSGLDAWRAQTEQDLRLLMYERDKASGVRSVDEQYPKYGLSDEEKKTNGGTRFFPNRTTDYTKKP